jgi:hypothetical protein
MASQLKNSMTHALPAARRRWLPTRRGLNKLRGIAGWPPQNPGICAADA